MNLPNGAVPRKKIVDFLFRISGKNIQKRYTEARCKKKGKYEKVPVEETTSAEL
jgi:hypothetical protein